MTLDRPRIWTPVFTRVFIAAFLNEVAFSMMISLPGYFKGLGASEGQIGLVVAVAAIVSLAMRPLIGRWLDLIGRKPIILVTSAINVVSLLLFMTVSEYGLWMFVTRAIFVASEISMFTAFLAYAADTLPAERRTQGLALYGLSGLVPIGLSSITADVVLRRFSFDALFLIASVAVAMSFAVATTLPRRPSDERGTEPRRSMWAAFAQRDLIPMWVIALTFAIALNVIFTYLRTFMDETGIGSVGLFFGTYSAFAIAIRLLGGRLGDVIGYRKIFYWTFGGLMLTQLVLSSTTSEVQLVAAAAIGGLGHGLLFPMMTSEIIRRARLTERGSALAIFTALFDIAVMTLVPVMGRIIDVSGYPLAFRATAGVVVVGLVAFRILDRQASAGLAQSANGLA